MNNYVFANNNGAGPAYSNMCVRAPTGKSFVDGEYHTYAFEWHTGVAGREAGGGGGERPGNSSGHSTDCATRVDFFFDGEYVGTNDVFVPTRGARFTFGVWPGGKNWCGQANWTDAYADIAEVHVCPFNEELDSMFPQVYDQPLTNPPLWEGKALPPLKPGLSPPAGQCPGQSLCSEGADRPTGCPCGNNSRVCSTGCCDYDALVGPTEGLCAPARVCKFECTRPLLRTFSCPCKTSSECASNCCHAGTCQADRAACVDPCSAALCRPNTCACRTVGQCRSGCCATRPAANGTTVEGTCAGATDCATKCEASSGRPIGCACASANDCKSNCCGGGVCEGADECPTPDKCQLPMNRPQGCPCTHSWFCASQWCENLHCVDH